MQGCCKLPFVRLRRREGRMTRGHLALRQRAVALCTPTSKRGIPNLATALDHNETYWYSTTYTFHKVQKYYALASEAGTFPGRGAIMSFNTFIVIWLTLHVADKSAVAAINDSVVRFFTGNLAERKKDQPMVHNKLLSTLHADSLLFFTGNPMTPERMCLFFCLHPSF